MEKRSFLDEVALFFKRVVEIFYHYFKAKLLISLILGALTYVFTLLLEIPYGGFWIALITAVFNLLPAIGPMVGLIICGLIVLFQDPTKAMWTALFLLGLQQVDGFVLTPLVMGQKLKVSPFLVIIAILAGGALFGVVGVLLAIPVAAVVQMIMVSYLFKKDETDEKQ
jgi:predicted PurR-regulated permease PerM